MKYNYLSKTIYTNDTNSIIIFNPSVKCCSEWCSIKKFAEQLTQVHIF